METINDILGLKIKPVVKRERLVESILHKEIPIDQFITFFISASDTDKGTCADIMKHVSEKDPGLLVSHIEDLIKHINYKAPRVKWGVQEAIGNLAKSYPERIEKAIPYLLENTKNNKNNSTVIKWCAAYALSEIAKHSIKMRKQLLPLFESIIRIEENNGVKNVYIKAIKAINKK